VHSAPFAAEMAFDADEWASIDLKKFLVYGGLFTVSVDFILYPLELVKTRVQVERQASVCP
jgi:hypothetical protein